MRLPKSVKNCGLQAAIPIKWLLGNEPDVATAVRKFIKGEWPSDYVDVVAPPDWLEQMRARRTGNIQLPVVRLRMKLTRQLDEWYVLVTCSDAEMNVLAAMRRAKIESDRRELNIARNHLAQQL